METKEPLPPPILPSANYLAAGRCKPVLLVEVCVQHKAQNPTVNYFLYLSGPLSVFNLFELGVVEKPVQKKRSLCIL